MRPARTYYLGKVNAGTYQLGTDPKLFHKGAGFSYTKLITSFPAKVAEDLFDIELKSGEIARLKKGTMKWVKM